MRPGVATSEHARSDTRAGLRSEKSGWGHHTRAIIGSHVDAGLVKPVDTDLEIRVIQSEIRPRVVAICVSG